MLADYIDRRALSHKESLHQITTACRAPRPPPDCHTKNHCIKSQPTSVRVRALSTVTQRIIASNHNSGLLRSCHEELSHKESLHQITTYLVHHGTVGVLSHKESLHQITTSLVDSFHVEHCHTKNHCIKSQLGRRELAGLRVLSHKESLHQITTRNGCGS